MSFVIYKADITQEQLKYLNISDYDTFIMRVQNILSLWIAFDAKPPASFGTRQRSERVFFKGK